MPDLARAYRRIPAPLRALAGSLVRDHRLQKLDRFARVSDQDAILYNASYLRPEVVSTLSTRLAPIDVGFRRERLRQIESLPLDAVGRASLLDQETFLIGVLNRQDKMSMAAAIESRVPFMDYRMVEFANSLPTALKVQGGVGKAIVKAYTRQMLPVEIVDRRKSGFGVPLANWFRANRGLGERVETLAEAPGLDLFDRTVVRGLVQQHRSGGHDHSEVLWTLLNLATWRQQFKC